VDACGSVLILTGPPGAGKSTIAEILTRDAGRPSVHLHADDFFRRYIRAGFVRAGFVAPWTPEAHSQNATVMSAVAAAAFAYAAGSYWVVVDGIVGPWFLDPFRAVARARELPLDYVVLRPQRETAEMRATDRRTHDLTDLTVVATMHRQFADLGSLEHLALDSTHLTPDATAAQVRALVASGAVRLDTAA